MSTGSIIWLVVLGGLFLCQAVALVRAMIGKFENYTPIHAMFLVAYVLGILHVLGVL